MPGKSRSSSKDEYLAAARKLIAGRSEVRVLAAMWPQQPDQLIRAVLTATRQDDVRLALLFADVPGTFDFLDESDGARLHDGSLQLITLAGAVPRRWSARTDHLPRSLWDTDRMIARGDLGIDVVLARVTGTADSAGVGLGDMVGYTPSALGTAAAVAFEVVAGPARAGTDPVPLERADVVLHTQPPTSRAAAVRAVTDVQDSIGRQVAGLVPDGATLQLGLGAVPEAVIARLAGRRDLGLHSGILSPALLDLIRSGVITGSRKSKQPGLHVATGIFDLDPTAAQRDWGDAVRLEPVSRTHAPDRLLGQERLWAVNSALEIDLAGQPNAEYAGGLRIASGGGQADFVRAAHASPGGAAVLALPSRTRDGRSRIVPGLGRPHVPTSAGADIDLVVTEHGVADLRGRTAAEVATELIRIAHPDDRASLLRESKQV